MHSFPPQLSNCKQYSMAGPNPLQSMIRSKPYEGSVSFLFFSSTGFMMSYPVSTNKIEFHLQSYSLHCKQTVHMLISSKIW